MNFKLLRSTFLQLLAALLGGSLLARFVGRQVTGKGARDPVFDDDWEPGEYRLVSSTCTLCPSLCGLQVRQTDTGKSITKLDGEPSHPVNDGALCVQGQASLQHLYNPERLKASILNELHTTTKVSTVLPPDQALTKAVELATNIGANPIIISRMPPGSLRDLLQALSKKWGARYYDFFPSHSSSLWGEVRQGESGDDTTEPYLSLAQVRCLLYFEGSILEETAFTMPVLREFGKLKGERPKAKIIALTSRQNMTSFQADETHFIRPGTGFVVALGILNLLSNRISISSAARIKGLPDVLKQARNYSPKEVQRLSGLPVNTLQRIVQEFAAARPSLALSEAHLMRTPTESGLFTAVMALNAVVGNTNHKGAIKPRTQISSSGKFSPPLFIRPDKLLASWKKSPPSFILHVDGDPVFSMHDKKTAKEILSKTNMISLSPYLNETNQLARLRLNTSTYFEEYQINRSNALPDRIIYGWNQPLVPLRSGVISRTKILLKLLGDAAPAVNELEYFNLTLAILGRRLKKKPTALKKTLIRQGYIVEKIKARPLRIELNSGNISKAVEQLSRLPKHALLAYPFQTMAVGDGSLNHIPWLRDLGGVHINEHWCLFAEINPATLAHLKISDRDIILIKRKDSKGKVLRARARVNPVVSSGIVALPLGYGKQAGGRYALSQHPENLYDLVHEEEWADTWIEVEVKRA